MRAGGTKPNNVLELIFGAEKIWRFYLARSAEKILRFYFALSMEKFLILYFARSAEKILTPVATSLRQLNAISSKG